MVRKGLPKTKKDRLVRTEKDSSTDIKRTSKDRKGQVATFKDY